MKDADPNLIHPPMVGSLRIWAVFAALAAFGLIIPQAEGQELLTLHQDTAKDIRDIRSWKRLHPALRPYLEPFLTAYPGHVESIGLHKNGTVQINTRTKTAVWLEDGVGGKNFDELLEAPDLVESLSQGYPLSMRYSTWPVNMDPGRFRNSDWLKSVYGSSEKEVQANLTSISFLGKKVSFNKRNGAAAALASVGRQLEKLISEKPALASYTKNLGGTFNWRPILNSGRLSAHCFGIAIDLNPDKGSYWEWEKGADLADMARRRDFPAEIVQCFEKQGFIWGGKWYHYDMMHFEYRPEFFGISPPKSTAHLPEEAPTEKSVNLPAKPATSSPEVAEKRPGPLPPATSESASAKPAKAWNYLYSVSSLEGVYLIYRTEVGMVQISRVIDARQLEVVYQADTLLGLVLHGADGRIPRSSCEAIEHEYLADMLRHDPEARKDAGQMLMLISAKAEKLEDREYYSRLARLETVPSVDQPKGNSPASDH